MVTPTSPLTPRETLDLIPTFNPHLNLLLLGHGVPVTLVVALPDNCYVRHSGFSHHGSGIGFPKVSKTHTLIEQEVHLLKSLSLTFWDTEVDEDDGRRHDGAKDESNLAVQAGVLVVDEVWDREVDGKTVCLLGSW